MKKSFCILFVIAAVLVSLCGSASAEQAEKDWYVSLRMALQPYTTEMSGKIGHREFDAKADLSDIMDNTDTTLLGGEVEFGKGRWFTFLSGTYQDTEAENGDTNHGSKVNFTEKSLNMMVGYRVLKQDLGDGRTFSLDAMGGGFYVDVKNDVNIYNPVLGNISHSESISFLDPMVGARMYYPFTKKFGAQIFGEIGGMIFGSEMHFVADARLVYNFTERFILSAGYKYWYWRWEDDGARLNELEQKVYGPVLGLEFKF
jgi:hypothetical protein